MRFTQSWLVAGALIVGAVLPNCSWARSSLDKIESRLARVEQILENRLAEDLYSQIENLQQEVRELRGLLEEQEHSLGMLDKRQETLYQDLDNRLSSGSKAVTSGSAQVEANVSAEQSAYNTAYKLVENKKFDDAVVKFKDFLWQYPNGKLAANAHYWLGEIYLSNWHKDNADNMSLDNSISAFNTVVKQYPDHHKAVDSMLKLGLIEVDKKNWQAAKNYFDTLIQKYPKSSRVRIAEDKLARLKEQGHI